MLPSDDRFAGLMIGDWSVFTNEEWKRIMRSIFGIDYEYYF